MSERYRYIRYADVFKELYDHQSDPNEWTNLVGLKKELRQWLPKRNAAAVPGKHSYKFDSRR